jgi:hypothetical protein
MPTLFDPLRVGNMELNNRIIMAPMTRSRANDEGVQPLFAPEYYSQRALASLIITEATNISPLAKGYVRTLGIYTGAQPLKPCLRGVGLIELLAIEQNGLRQTSALRSNNQSLLFLRSPSYWGPRSFTTSFHSLPLKFIPTLRLEDT